jgi:DNA-binding transcriptional ArsR family regulator
MWLHMNSPTTPYKAISDSTRRQILDLLREKNRMTAGSIAQSFPEISRPAVSKHLRILRGSDLVRTRRLGRERIYSINPAPLRQIAEWLRQYQVFWDEQLTSLKDFVESTQDQGGK